MNSINVIFSLSITGYAYSHFLPKFLVASFFSTKQTLQIQLAQNMDSPLILRD